MAEIVKGPFPYDQARNFLTRLMDDSNAFKGGSRPYVGKLKISYGYKKVIGVKSFDNKVYTRIDYDPDKGFHFNFIDDNTGDKICILISDMTEEKYKRYIDNMTIGKDLIEQDKSAIIRYNPRTGIKLDYDEKEDAYFYHTDKGRKKVLYAVIKGLSQDIYKKTLEEMTKLSPKAIAVPKTSVSAPGTQPGGGYKGSDGGMGFITQVYPQDIFILDEFMFFYYVELYLMELEEAKENNTEVTQSFDEFITVNVAQNYDQYLKANNLYDENYDKKANLNALLSQIIDEEKEERAKHR